MGGAIDTLNIVSGNISNSFIGAGAGNDIVVIDAISGNLAEVLGGGGNDIVRYSGAIGGAGLEINGDSGANGGGADTISFEGILSGSTVRGKGGKDVITVSGVSDGNASEILGNAGADVINVTGGMAGSAQLLGAGSGNDTIFFSGASLGDTNSVVGGGGADSITISVSTNLSGAVYGGLGADTIVVTETGAGGWHSGIGFAFNSLAESTISKMDIYTGAGVISGGSYSGGMVFSFSAVAALTTGIAAGTGFDQNYEGGVLTGGAFTEAGTAAGVTARVTLRYSVSVSRRNILV